MKFEYKIPTPIGEITRKSAREYTHVVVGGKKTEAAMRKLHKWYVDLFAAELTSKTQKTTPDAADLRRIKELEQFLANEAQILADDIANRKPFGVLGYASRADLAQKVASGWQARECEEVFIVEILPEHRREIVTRKRK